MINDKLIETNSALYWSIFKDPIIEKQLNKILNSFKKNKENFNKKILNQINNFQDNSIELIKNESLITEAAPLLIPILKGIGSAAIFAWPFLKKYGGKLFKTGGKIVKSKPVKVGGKLAAGTAIAGAGIDLGANLAADGLEDLKNTTYLNKIIQFCKENPDQLKIAAITMAAAVTAYTFKTQINNRLSQLLNWFKRGMVIAKCEFTAATKRYIVIFDDKTLKWSLLNANGFNGKVNKNDVYEYFETDHFKRFSTQCKKQIEKLTLDKDFMQLAQCISKDEINLDKDFKKFFKFLVENQKSIPELISQPNFNI